MDQSTYNLGLVLCDSTGATGPSLTMATKRVKEKLKNICLHVSRLPALNVIPLDVRPALTQRVERFILIFS